MRRWTKQIRALDVKGGVKLRRVAGRNKTAALPGNFCKNSTFFAAVWAVKWTTIFSRKERKCIRTWNNGYKSDKGFYEKESANAKY
ncbi:hypothetical protein ES703_104297 [subsurface metagenome]